ncbi:phosphatidate cytidylyltransferase [Dongia deserti]|uniref:phosphatidate cytidylyltransferase n=1 Tax=Dongia deserti TaxID=2268030 RepID=UPI000E649141|nr:phosphatidate cytidylyltransferase [Dongia deserti]
MAQPADRPPSKPTGGLTNLQKRILSAAVLLPLVVVEILLGHPYFDLLIAVFVGIMAWEWARVCARRRNPADPTPAARLAAEAWLAPGLVSILTAVAAVLATGFGQGGLVAGAIIAVGATLSGLLALTHHRSRAAWFSVGTIYVTLPALALLAIRADPRFGEEMLFWTIAMVVAADTGGYLVGRSVGGPKLAPRISPNKTWAGLGGAVAGTALVGLLTGFILNHTNVLILTLMSAGLGVVEQAGDLVESAFKRHFGVKDTSQIIPGHGGVLDRVDGLLAVALVVVVMNKWVGGSVLAW